MHVYEIRKTHNEYLEWWSEFDAYDEIADMIIDASAEASTNSYFRDDDSALHIDQLWKLIQ